MNDRRRKNGIIAKVVAAVILMVVGWIGSTVWFSALKISALEANQSAIQAEILEIKAAALRIERTVKSPQKEPPK